MTHFTKVFSTLGTVLLFFAVWLIVGSIMYFGLVFILDAPAQAVPTKIAPTVLGLFLTVFIHAIDND
jgi:hypothetical protein